LSIGKMQRNGEIRKKCLSGECLGRRFGHGGRLGGKEKSEGEKKERDRS
jgi:hypothetical protein